MTVIRKKKIDKAFEIYLALYQGLTNYDEDSDAYREFSPDFFDLIVVDECHRGSAAADSAWREILDYFKSSHSYRFNCYTQGNQDRLQHRILWRTALHLLAQTRDS